VVRWSLQVVAVMCLKESEKEKKEKQSTVAVKAVTTASAVKAASTTLQNSVQTRCREW